MKKTLLLGAAASILFCGANAQDKHEASFNRGALQLEKSSEKTFAKRAPGDIYWSDDFSDASNWITDGPSGGNDPTVEKNPGWTISSTYGTDAADGLVFAPNYITDFFQQETTSGAEYAIFTNLLVNSQGQIVVPADEENFTLTNVNPIDLRDPSINDSTVMLQFYCGGRTFVARWIVEVSTDGANWTEVGEPDYETNAYVIPADLVQFDITDAIAGGANNVYVRFRFMGDQNGGSYNYGEYGWMIDDVAIVDAIENNLVSDSTLLGTPILFTGGERSYFPSSIFTADILDNSAYAIVSSISQLGISDMTGAYIECELVDTAENVLWTSKSDLTGLSDSTIGYNEARMDTIVGMFTSADLTYYGRYELRMTVISDQIDATGSSDYDPSNNVSIYSFYYSENQYGRDKLYNNNDVPGTAGQDQVNEPGEGTGGGMVNAFDMYGVTTWNGISVGFSADPDNESDYTNAECKVYVLDASYDSDLAPDAQANAPLAETEWTSLSNADKGTIKNIAFTSGSAVIGNELTLDAVNVAEHGTVWIAVVWEDGSDLTIATNGSYKLRLSAQFSRASILDFSWTQKFGTAFMPVVRLLQDETLSTENLDEASFNLNAYPNPANEEISIDYTLVEGSDVVIEIKDVMGKIVATYNPGNQVIGNHTITVDIANLTNGLYFYSVKAGENVVTNKFEVSK